jgi:hypothetical protein
MDGDIKLDVNIVRVEGDRLEVIPADIVLDNPHRRGPNNVDNFRRALVHDMNDGLDNQLQR